MKKKLIWLVLAAVFILAMVGGYLLMGREIRVSVDGHTSTVFTRAITVRQLLRDMGYKPTDADEIQPAPQTWLSNVDAVTFNRSRSFSIWEGPSGKIIHIDFPANTPRELLAQAGINPAEDDAILINGKRLNLDDPLPTSNNIVLQHIPAVPITITMDGKTSVIRSTRATFGQALWENKIHGDGSDFLSIPFSLPLISGQEIILTKPISINIKVDGMSLKSTTTATTVGQALQINGISMQNLDYSVPSEDSPVPEDGLIRVVRVREEIQVTQQSIPYHIKYQSDNTLKSDQKKVVTAGQKGIAVAREIIRYEDGVETSRETVESVTLVEPIDELVSYGTVLSYSTLDTEYGPLTYYRTETVYATSYSPCQLAIPGDPNACNSITASGATLTKGIIATTRSWYQIFQGTKFYVPGYGIGTVADIGGGVSGKYWIDLGYSDADWVSWSQNVTIYFLAPAPANVPGILP